MPDKEVTAPLSPLEAQVRESMGFADLSTEELTHDFETARESIAEAGIRMTADELTEFDERLQLADAAAFLMAELRDRDDFAGFFFDPPTGQYVARTTTDRSAMREAIGAQLPADRVRVEVAERTIGELEAIANSIVPVFEVKDESLVVDPARFAPYVEQISVMVRHVENEVWVAADPDLPQDVLEDLERIVGDQGKILQSSGLIEQTCIRDRCRPAVRPGARIYVGNTPGTCSAGLPFRSGNDAFLSTAGHCSDTSATPDQRFTSHYRDSLSSGHGTFPRYVAYSRSTDRRNDSGLDAQLFPMARDLASTTPWGETSSLNSSYWMNGIPAGTTVEVSRGNSYSVGSAVFDGYVSIGTRLMGLMRSNITISGDSGSPWYVNRRAAGNHVGLKNWVAPPDYQNAPRSVFDQVQVIENEFGVTYKTDSPLPERLANDRFIALSGGWPTSWYALSAPGGTIANAWYANTGHLDEHGVEFNCGGAAGCSVYQDVAITTNTWNRISAGVWVFCNSWDPCPVTLAVWGHGDSTPNAVLTDNETIQPHQTAYLWVQDQLATGNHPLLRFQVYNSSTGRNIRISSTQLHR